MKNDDVFCVGQSNEVILEKRDNRAIRNNLVSYFRAICLKSTTDGTKGKRIICYVAVKVILIFSFVTIIFFL